MKIGKLTELYGAFSDETRLKILMLLLEQEANVSEIAERCELTVSNASHQLKYLKKIRLVKTRKEGKYVFYSLDDDHVSQIIQFGIDHISE